MRPASQEPKEKTYKGKKKTRNKPAVQKHPAQHIDESPQDDGYDGYYDLNAGYLANSFKKSFQAVNFLFTAFLLCDKIEKKEEA